jgi:ribosome-associated translation inhibitor RaiA
MKIFRGPSEKDFSDDTHQLVSEPDLKLIQDWRKRVGSIRANVSKEPHERQAVVHLVFNPDDVLALQASLVHSLVADSKHRDVLEEKIQKLQQVLRQIKLKASFPSEDALSYIKAEAEKALAP